MTISKKNLSEIILPVYHDLHKDIKSEAYSEYILDGGRGSGKSTFIGTEIPLDICRDSLKGLKSDTVVIRKVSKTHKKSTYNQLLECISLLGKSDNFLALSSPLEIRYYPNGKPKSANAKGREAYTNSIHFIGMDDSEKIKSFKVQSGHYIKNLWIEEPTELDSMEEIENSVYQSLLRGHDMHTNIFLTYNPPLDDNNFMNVYTKQAEKRADCRHVHTTYLDVPPSLLGKSFINIATRMKEENEKSYKHIYLGEVSGLTSRIYTNVYRVRYTKEHLLKLANDTANHVRGLDFGFTDPNGFVVSYYDKENKDVYVLMEMKQSHQTIDELYSALYDRVGASFIRSDTNNATVINELQNRGLNINPVNKALKGVVSQLEWLSLNINHIFVDDTVTPEFFNEITSYVRKKDKNTGKLLPEPAPNQEDHLMDAFRYSLYDIIHN